MNGNNLEKHYNSVSNEKEINPETLAQKVSILMTKPENTDTSVPLLLVLKNNGLKAKTFRFTLNEDMLKGLYPNIQNLPEIWQATKDHMLGKEVEVFLITKDVENTSEIDVLEEVVKLVGTETKPEDNAGGTLRKHLSGEVKTIQKENGDLINYFENGFHRPQNTEELIKNLEVFGLLEQAQNLVNKTD